MIIGVAVSCCNGFLSEQNISPKLSRLKHFSACRSVFLKILCKSQSQACFWDTLCLEMWDTKKNSRKIQFLPSCCRLPVVHTINMDQGGGRTLSMLSASLLLISSLTKFILSSGFGMSSSFLLGVSDLSRGNFLRYFYISFSFFKEYSRHR